MGVPYYENQLLPDFCGHKFGQRPKNCSKLRKINCTFYDFFYIFWGDLRWGHLYNFFLFEARFLVIGLEIMNFSDYHIEVL